MGGGDSDRGMGGRLGEWGVCWGGGLMDVGGGWIGLGEGARDLGEGGMKMGGEGVWGGRG